MSGNTQILKKKKMYNKEAFVFLKDNCKTITKGMCITKENLGDPSASDSQNVAHSWTIYSQSTARLSTKTESKRLETFMAIWHRSNSSVILTEGLSTMDWGKKSNNQLQG